MIEENDVPELFRFWIELFNGNSRGGAGKYERKELVA